jgi:hypothetical protein
VNWSAAVSVPLDDDRILERLGLEPVQRAPDRGSTNF